MITLPDQQAITAANNEPQTVITMIIQTPEKQTMYYAHAEHIYQLMHGFIKMILSGGMAGEAAEHRQLIGLIRIGIKGILIAYGNQILTAVMGTENHPKPGKKDDLIAWYTDIFTQIGIMKACQGTLVLNSTRGEPENGVSAIEVDHIYSVPVAEVSATRDAES